MGLAGLDVGLGCVGPLAQILSKHAMRYVRPAPVAFTDRGAIAQNHKPLSSEPVMCLEAPWNMLSATATAPAYGA